MKRTYSRRNMTMVPTTLSASPENTTTNKRRKEEPQDEAGTGAKSMASGKHARQKPRSKKFGGPVSMPDDHDPMDIDDGVPTQKPKGDASARVLKHFKAGTATPAQNSAFLYGDLEEFNSLVQSKKSVKAMTGAVQPLGPTKNVPRPAKDAFQPTLKAAGPPNPVNVLAHKMQVAALMKQAFEGKEYQAAPSPLPSRDINGKKIAPGSMGATLWPKNQAQSPFLRLPKNVRKMIYEHALGGQSIDIYYTSYKKISRDNDLVDRVRYFKYDCAVFKITTINGKSQVEKTRGMTLLNGLCRQLHRETSTLVYKYNDIRFRTHLAMFNFIAVERRLRTKQLNVIEKLYVRQDLPDPLTLALLPNLKRVFLIVRDHEKIPLAQQKLNDWNPPAGGWYDVVEDSNGRRKLEKEQKVWGGWGSSSGKLTKLY